MKIGEDHSQGQEANAAKNSNLLRDLTAKALKVATVKRSMASVRKAAYSRLFASRCSSMK